MPEFDAEKESKQFYADIPVKHEPFFLKGAGALDWGMQNRLARVFNPASGRTVMLAIDHGYFQGPTTGLERIDLNIVPLLPYTNALMLTRGILRTTIPASFHPRRGAAGQRRSEHPEGTFQRADRCRHRRRGAAQCFRHGRAGLRGRRIRDADRSTT